MSQTDADLLKEYERRSKETPWLTYPITCVPKIRPWHEAKNDYCVLSGPNGGGKSTAGAARLVSVATGFDPFTLETWPVPNICWGVCVEYKSAGNVMKRKLFEMLPKYPDGSRAFEYIKQDHIIKIHASFGGSEIHIKSQKEGESSLLGERCAAIWVDEAMGGEVGLENFGELQARGLPDQPLKMFFTLTPKMDIGIEWMKRKLWCEPGQTPHEEFIKDTFCHSFELKDCLQENGGYISPARYKKIMETTDPAEMDARVHGKWTPFFTRPAFSWGLLMKAMERAPAGKHVRWRPSRSTPVWEDCTGGPGKLIRERESGHEYLVSWDPSSGLGKGHDPSALVVFDRGDLAVVYQARSFDLGPVDFAHQIAIPAAKYFNRGKLIIENNGEGGQAAIGAVRDHYDNIYKQKNYVKAIATFTDTLGWRTSDQSRGRIIDSLKRALEDDKWTPSYDLVEEMGHMVKRPGHGNIPRVEHADGYHDDLCMAAGIALAVHYEEPVIEWPDFRRLKVRYGPRYSRSEIAWN